MKSRASRNTIVAGRFAPSPTGSLHLGSLMAAVCSYLNIYQQQGIWYIRIDDLDTPRVVSGSQSDILKTLEDYGFEWHSIIQQSQRLAFYNDALSTLVNQHLVYPCRCSRSQIFTRTKKSGMYDNYCRAHLDLNTSATSSWRIITNDEPIIWTDLIQGEQCIHCGKDGDFLVKRSDNIFAYHLACAFDDGQFGITEVIRGADLCVSSAHQQWIQKQLNMSPPKYGHHPVIVDEHLIKLSKANAAPSIRHNDRVYNLWKVLDLLGQNPPTSLCQDSLENLWLWAKKHWCINKVPKQQTISLHET